MAQQSSHQTIEEVDILINDKCVKSLEEVSQLMSEASAISMQKFDKLIVDLKVIRFEYVDFLNRMNRTSPTTEWILRKMEEVQNNITLLEKSVFMVEDSRRYYQIKLFNESNMALLLQTLATGFTQQSN